MGRSFSPLARRNRERYMDVLYRDIDRKVFHTTASMRQSRFNMLKDESFSVGREFRYQREIYRIAEHDEKGFLVTTCGMRISPLEAIPILPHKK